MKLSIVIPTKNEEVLLPMLLESIRGQSFTDYEIIVADAKSTDETPRIAASFGARVVEGAMPAPGRNRGAHYATGDKVVFFDADVVLPNERFLQDCLEEMDRRGLDVATCRVKADKGTLVDHALHGAYNVYTLATEKIIPHAPGFCLIAKREAHQKINGFDEEVVFAEDHDYVQRAKKAGLKFGILRKHKIPVSIRRMQKDGRANTAMKYMFTELHMLTRGSMKKNLFRYDMGGDAHKGDATDDQTPHADHA